MTTPRCRVISDNDYAGDPDGLVQLAHLLLSPSAQVRAVIGSHLAVDDPFGSNAGDSAARAYQRVQEVLDLVGMAGQVPTYQGTELPLVDTDTPRESAAADAIIEEAMRTDTDLPLFATFGGGLTELASAYLREPRIADRMTAIWIGGPEYPELAVPPPGALHPEYNLNIDVAAAQVVFDSPIPLWQVPRDAYRQVLVGMAELRAGVAPAGRLGRYLFDRINDAVAKVEAHGHRMGETFVLGDNPLVLLTALQSAFEPDPSSSQYVLRPAPRITDDGSYEHRDDGRTIRVYTRLDLRLLVGDLFAKLSLQ
ncbi:nucleoside hydrolase [Natronosporangium hydrolyticum]|uniref:Nucleoside hydrolase n=1 Tax=Natronosporangium hydrolyticum TaxID=2811111 RepID=A0A895YBP1_9ACTN|nr:nucleoside hydrolase [Natronosporangium hydrolyticum]QSB12873.1 nucleoside hydrolase [Natronosporangium hydrolyticum]